MAISRRPMLVHGAGMVIPDPRRRPSPPVGHGHGGDGDWIRLSHDDGSLRLRSLLCGLARERGLAAALATLLWMLDGMAGYSWLAHQVNETVNAMVRRYAPRRDCEWVACLEATASHGNLSMCEAVMRGMIRQQQMMQEEEDDMDGDDDMDDEEEQQQYDQPQDEAVRERFWRRLQAAVVEADACGRLVEAAVLGGHTSIVVFACRLSASVGRPVPHWPLVLAALAGSNKSTRLPGFLVRWWRVPRALPPPA